MEKVVHQSQFAIAKFDDKKALYTLIYLPETANMSNKEWKDLMTELLIVTDMLKPRYILDDNRDRLYAYPPEIQDWTLKLFLETWQKNGLLKYVQVLPKDFINELSAEQIVQLANLKFSNVFDNTFVKTIEEAIKWLDIQ
ncbi:MAG: hypothetical protein U5K79_21725 [Cyclobacteriaceae bacterium]|nr:hypothetical protein [Cyclobacteriaceae bacterium]